MTEFQRKVYNIVRRIPCGKVMTYAAVAKAIGNPRATRAVGNALNKNKEIAALALLARHPRNKLASKEARDEEFHGVPCHRVIRSDGFVGGFACGIREKMKLLRREGVKIYRGKVDPRNLMKI